MSRAPISLAAVSCLALAGIGYFSGLDTLDCSVRALSGAGVVYVLVRIGQRVFFSALVDAAVRSHRQTRNPGDQT